MDTLITEFMMGGPGALGSLVDNFLFGGGDDDIFAVLNTDGPREEAEALSDLQLRANVFGTSDFNVVGNDRVIFSLIVCLPET